MVFVIDQYYLTLTALVTIGYQLSFFFFAATLKIDTVTDFAGGTNFALLALLTFLLHQGHRPVAPLYSIWAWALGTTQTYYVRQIVMTAFVLAWALRLSGFLFWRILKIGHDHRFDEMRGKFWSFLGFWVFQMIWVWTVSLPVTVLNSFDVDTPFGIGTDIAGVICFGLGLLVEMVADVQKTSFKFNAANKGKWCDVGLWKYSRHPNYAGEILLWIGLFLLGSYTIQVDGSTWFIIFSPLLIIVLLMFLSGLPMLEKPANARWSNRADYQEYKRSTSILILMPPFIYRPLPHWVKVVFFFEWPIYNSGPESQSLNN